MPAIFAQIAEPNRLREMIDTAARTPLSQVVITVAFLTVLRLALHTYLVGTPAHKRVGGFRVMNFFNELFDAIIYAGVFVFMLIRPFGVQTFTIPTGSMIDTLLVNDYIIANKATYRYSDPKYGDIVVFKAPKVALRPGVSEEDYIKRCIGVPGDTIEIRNGSLYRNGVLTPEPYVWFEPGTVTKMTHDFKLVDYKGQIWPVSMQGEFTNADPQRSAEPYYLATSTEMDIVRSLPPAKVPAGFYLMMGDNREGSYDGRAWGLVPRSDIIGKSMAIWLPLNRIGQTR